jgi:hypothetical protein
MNYGTYGDKMKKTLTTILLVIGLAGGAIRAIP